MCSLKCVIWWVSPQTFPFGRRLADKAPRGRETYGGCCLFPLGCAQPRLHQEGPQGSGWLPAFLWGHLCVARHCLARCKPACGACCAGHILALPRVGSWLRVLELVKVLKVASGHRDSCCRHSHWSVTAVVLVTLAASRWLEAVGNSSSKHGSADLGIHCVPVDWVSFQVLQNDCFQWWHL